MRAARNTGLRFYRRGKSERGTANGGSALSVGGWAWRWAVRAPGRQVDRGRTASVINAINAPLQARGEMQPSAGRGDKKLRAVGAGSVCASNCNRVRVSRCERKTPSRCMARVPHARSKVI